LHKAARFITPFGGAAVATPLSWPLAERAQLSRMPVIGFLGSRTPDTDAHLVDALRKGLAEVGYTDGRNVTIEFR
jgi:putative ABC transport system substrate-binding protein